jgi:DNA-binding XRE family transcriptional regulator
MSDTTTVKPSFTFGEKLKGYRRRATMEQDEVAKAIGVSRTTLSNWECSRFLPRINQRKQVLLLKDTLSLSPEEMDDLLIEAKFRPEYSGIRHEKLYKDSDTSEDDPQTEQGISRISVALLVSASFCSVIFIVVWSQSFTNSTLNYLSNIYLTLPLIGGGAGLWKLRSQFKSVERFPLSFVFYSSALVSWALGNTVWVIYNIRQVPIPYPSVADAAFFINNILWASGIICHVYQATPIQAAKLRHLNMRMVVMYHAMVLLMSGLRNGLSQPDDAMKYLLDVLLPFVSGVAFAFAYLWYKDASFADLTPSERQFRRFLCVGTFFLFLADFGFSIGTLVPGEHWLAYVNGGWQDISYAIAFFTLSFAVSKVPMHSVTKLATVSEFTNHLKTFSTTITRRLVGKLSSLKQTLSLR